jgi:hypothetical protein
VLLKDLNQVQSVHLLGSDTPLKFKLSKAGALVDLPELPETLRQQPAWVLRLSR